MAKRHKLHEVSLEDDIRYRGPISFQGFQVLGWLCIVASVILSLLNLARNADPDTAKMTEGIVPIIETIAEFSLPFLLIANYSRILNNSEGYKKQLLRTGGTAAAIVAGSYFIYTRYIVDNVRLFVEEPGSADGILEDLIHRGISNGFVDFNIFIDLFLCALFMFFLNVRPKRVFTGKKVLILRFFALVPVAYELASLALKDLAASHRITLPLWSFPLLTVKPPMTFVLFMFLAIHIKVRERRFCRHGRSHEEYLAYLNTNRNSLHFSLWLMFLLVLTAVLDVIALILFSAVTAVEAGAGNTEDQMLVFVKSATALGFGQTIPQLFLLPLMLLYSYSRVPKNKTFGLLIPVIGIALIFLVILEFGHLALGIYVPRLNASIAAQMENPETQQMLLLLETVSTEALPVP